MAPIHSNNNPAADSGILASMALQIALGQLGQQEQPIGSNSGPMVNEYLKSVGLHPGYAWCQAFVYWCYGAAAQKLNRVNPVVKTGSVHECWSKTPDAVKNISRSEHMLAGSTKILKADALPEPKLITPGTQFTLSFGQSAGHTGIVEKTEILQGGRETIIHTIEGNSNNNGTREGFEVVRHQRNINDKSLLGFIKYS